MFKAYQIVDWWLGLKGSPVRSAGKAEGMLLVSSGGLGDTILFSAIIDKFLDLARPGEPVQLIVQSKSKAVQFLFPPSVQVTPIDYRRFLRNPFYRYRVSRGLREKGFRLAVSTDHLRLPTVDDALVFACDAEETYALEPRSWPKHDRALARNARRYTKLVKPEPGMAHRFIRWLELINGLMGTDDPPPLVRINADRFPPAVDFERPTVVLHPFSAVHEKQFPVALWVRIVENLAPGHDIVLSAAPGDLDGNPEFKNILDLPGVSLDTNPLEEKAALLRSAALVVSVDTSMMHLAVLAGSVTLCLATAAHVIDSTPYDPRMTPDNVTFLFHDMPCRGCLGNCIHPLEDGFYPCVRRLDEDQVLTKVKALTEQRGDTAK